MPASVIREIQRKTTYFECPKCKGDMLEEVARSLSYTQIAGFYDEDPDYWDTNSEHVDVVRIQCYDCGFEVCQGHPRNLRQFLIEQGWMSDTNKTESPPVDWEV